MTKRGEIRMALIHWFAKHDAQVEAHTAPDMSETLGSLLVCLDSVGLVIKVCERDVGGGFVGSYTRPEILYEVEPLVVK